MNKTIGIVVAGVVVAGAAFAGGYYLSGALPGAASGVAGTQGPGGFAQLTDAERQQLQSMSDEERQAFFEEQGIDMPSGGPGGPGAPDGQTGARGAGGRPGGGAALLEGVVAQKTSEKLTIALAAGGSASAYVDDATVVAAPPGVTPDLVEGAAVLVFTEPEAAGVNAAKAIIIAK